MFRTLTLASIMACAAAFSLASGAMAADEYNVSTGLTGAGAPLGLHGVDPVAFIASGDPVVGAAQHTIVHDGVAYRFATAENGATFKADPAAYLPQNGGFCTFGVSVGKKFDGDPDYAAVIDDKLYVFLNEDIFKAFNEDRTGVIAKAATNWSDIRSTAVEDL
ncbi:YHS domain-containing (seleno)protein [uncultured Tateyamaria sp.]|uniref:YHS domain-containing (seleno)protein n=1 Tax=uncultured Tateyamaria sp. TaxID=455651 RepID=UPI002612B6CC|nr:YHS domain-containing (seleno)protein [uncultured Tateyamaria sp.]